MTVGDLLSRRSLRLSSLVEGDLSRVIRWVHSLDLSDPSAYLRGDEVILTTGLWYDGAGSARRYVARLADPRVAALGFGVNPQVPEVPPELVDAARELGLTLFVVPPDVPFIAVTQVFVEAHAHDRERPLRDALARNSQLVRSLQRRDGLQGLLRLLLRYHPGTAALVARGRGLLATAGRAQLPGALVAAVGESGLEGLAASGGYAGFAVPTQPGTLLVVSGAEGDFTVTEQAAIEQVLAFIAIELQRLRTLAETERRYMTELLDLIEDGAALPVVTARLRTFDLLPEQGLTVICAEPGEIDAHLELLNAFIAASGRKGVSATKGTQLIAVVSGKPGEEPSALAAAVSESLGRSCPVGVGGIARDVAALRTSLIGARHACAFAARHGLSHADHDSLASHALLIGLQDQELLRRFEEILIRPLAEHDARRHSRLVETLDLFLSSGCQFQATARALHVHVNTLRLRLERIEQLTGRSLASMEDRVDFWIALRTRDDLPGPARRPCAAS